MMIRVYDGNERLFGNNGIKILHPLLAEVFKEDNGDYYCQFRDTIENLEYYQQGMIITVPTPFGVQGFRCDNPIIENKKVSSKAWHLSYDSQNYIIADSYAADKNCNDALAHFNANTDKTSPFSTISDISTVISTRAVRKSLYDVLIWLTSEDKYNGHLFRDNWTIGIKSAIGEDRGVTLKYGKNITDISVEEDWSEVCTKILPYTTDGETAITLDMIYIELSENMYDTPYTKIVQFDNPYTKEDYANEEAFLDAVKLWLQSEAENYLQSHKLPKVNYKVSAHLQNVSDVGDTIKVQHPKYNVDITTQVISVTYDVIAGKYTSIEFGNFKRELKNLTESIKAELKSDTKNLLSETKTLLHSELVEATSQINKVLGNSYVVYDGDKILVVDNLPKENARNVIKISSGGIGFSNTGINGTFNSAWTIDGTLDMQNVNVINLTASMIKGGVLTLGGLSNSSGTIELYDNQNRLSVLADRGGITVFATNGDYVKLNAVDGFAGYNKNGVKVYWADGNTFHMKNAEVENELKVAGKVKIVPVSTSETIGIGFVAIS